MKNFNWGHGITLFYLVFVGCVATALIASFGVDHSLVVDDYYQHDLGYQSQYDKTTNALHLSSVVISHDRKVGELTVDLDTDGSCLGSIQMYRPADKSQDFTVPVRSGEVVIPVDGVAPGKWIVKADWQAAGKTYYYEESIVL